MQTLTHRSHGFKDTILSLRPWSVAVVALLFLLPFLPGITGPFQLDDASNLSRMHLRVTSLEAIYEAVFNNPSGLLRRPLSNATLLLQAQLGAEGPLSYKAVNLLLHSFNGWLVWHLACRLLSLLLPAGSERSRRATALMTAVVWMLHPLQVSTVLYVVQRMTLLSSMFMLLSVLLALRPLSNPGALPRVGDGLRHALLVGLVAFAALLCKENGALVPVLLFAILLSLPRESLTMISDSKGKQAFIRAAVVAPCLLGIIVIVMAWQELTASYAGRLFTLSQRLVTEAWVLGDYVLSILVPLPARMGLYADDVTVRGTTTAGWYIAPLLVVAAIIGATFVRRRYPILTFAVFWFIACHLLESTFIPLELKYEHRNYLALLGPVLLIGTWISGLSRLVGKRLCVVISAALVMLLSGMTLLRSLDWSSESRFITSELRHHPQSLRANMEVARLESAMGRNDAAAARIHALQEQYPDQYAPLGGSLELGCAGYPVRWDRVGDYMSRHPHDASIQNQRLYATLTGYLLGHVCAPGFDAAFSKHVDAAIDLYASNGPPQGLQFFLMVKAGLTESQQARRALLLRAISAVPEEAGPLIQLAYLDLSLGDAASARKTIDRLKALVPPWHPDRMYIRELERRRDIRGSS